MANTLADIRARVLTEYKRTDTSTQTVNRWIVDAVRRIQRTLTSPIDETISAASLPVGFNGIVQVPGNLVELISIQAHGRDLQMRPVTEVKGLQRIGLQARADYYAREAGNYLIAPLPAPGTQVEIYYRADYGALVADTDTCPLFDIVPDLVMYGALILSSGYAIDDQRMVTWNSFYNALFAEIQDLAYRNELTNASVQPAFSFNGGAY